ncbi:FAD-dependent oxidoreductase [Virgibacillus sp. C22-A2]|uniref:FAD-dependent oxidoreductase n=1 Tax=Virgibacillus tibetensis TaxID=3042313 RepID=A0ABU6KL82_9BACI|nr:FAD-dependent oxidoreductase [Virgibacillus sp. C22-A2]
MTHFKHLFTSLEIGNTTLKNRILSTAHQTNHVKDGIPTTDMAAYHVERAKGGIGLIILEAAAVHKSGILTGKTIAGYDKRIIPAYSDIADQLHHYGTKVFSQLLHGGREVISSTYRYPSWAPSAEPSLRFGSMPRPLSKEDIEEVIEGFADSAKIAKDAGLDGVEFACSHGYLPSQFWSSHTNHRTDEFGGSFENRMRFSVEVIKRIWEKVGEDFTVGIRMSADEKTMDGLNVKDSTQIVEYLVEKVRLDFINVTSGDSSTYSGSTHIAPASPMKHAYNAPSAFKLRMAGAVPVFVGTRILDPKEAEDIVSTGKADAVGMTRATITDPEMPNKALNNNLHLINACIGCLQACIGHYHKGLQIGCVQNPLAGKEAQLSSQLQKKGLGQHVLVIGSGPAGIQAAITADRQGYKVTLVEQSNKIGGLLNTMKKAPMRHEMAETMLDNYQRQLSTTNIDIQLNKKVTSKEVISISPDIIISAVGSRTYKPHRIETNDTRVIYVDDLFSRQNDAIGKKTIVFDFAGDWSGIEASLYLAEKGKEVTLITAKLHVGQEVHQYLRNSYMKRLYELNVQMITHHDFGGIEGDKAFSRNLFTHETIDLPEWDNIILAYGRVPNTELYEDIKHLAPTIHQIGDCLSPRTIEEATTEGLETILHLQDSNETLSIQKS